MRRKDTSTAYQTEERQNQNREKKIVSLSQQLPKIAEWADLLVNSKNKGRLTLLLADFFLPKRKNMRKDVYFTKGNQCYHSTVEVPNNAVEVPDLKSNHKEEHLRIALHTAFGSSAHEPSAVCVVADDADIYIYILLLNVSQYCCEKMYFRLGSRLSTMNQDTGIMYHDVESLGNLWKKPCPK